MAGVGRRAHRGGPVNALVFARAFARARWLARRFRSRDDLRRWQNRRAAAHLARVASHAPFLAERLRGVRLADGGWRDVPPVAKADVLARFADANTAGVRLDDALAVAERAEATRDFAPELPTPRGPLTVGLSTGTSGRRGVFLASPAERAAWAGTVLARALHVSPLRRGGLRVALVLRAGGPLYESVGRGPLAFRFFDLLAPVADLVAAVGAYRPDVLVAPPAALRILAEAQRAGRLRLTPRQVTSCADVLGPDDAAAVTDAWGVPPGEIYQATEGFLGATCAHGTLHLNEDAVVVQPGWLDDDGHTRRPSPPTVPPLPEGEGFALSGSRAEGTVGRRFVPVLTDLRRTTQPALRLRLDDVLVAGPPCPCGSILRPLARVEGRTDDVLRWPTAGGTRLVFPDFVRRAVAGAHPAVRDFRVTQTGAQTLDVALDLDGGDEAPRRAVAEALGALARRLGARPMTVRFVAFQALPPGAKQRRVRRARTVRVE